MATERLDIVITERGSRKVSRNIAKIGTASRAAQTGVSLLRSALGALGGALVLRSAIRTLADFGQAMSTIQAVTGQTGAKFDSLKEKAKELGIQTRFSATQAADAMVFLSRTGFDAAEVLATVDGALALAQVGMLEIGRAADIASNVLKGFRLEASDMNKVVDILAKTSSSANTNIEQLGDAMSFAAPAAAALGVSIEETAAAVGVLSDAGIQASRAGSGLRTSFIKLLKPTAEAKQLIRDLGLEQNALNINSRGLIPVLETLAEKNIGLADAATLVSVRQASNLLILIDSLPRLKELAELNEKAAGTAQKMATVMDDNLNGALLRVKSAFQGIILSLGAEGGTNSLRSLLEKTAEGLRIMAKNVNVLVPALEALAFVLGAVLARAAIGLLISQLKKLGVAVLALAVRTLPLLAATAAAAFLTLALAAEASGKSIKETFEELKAAVSDLVGGLFDAAVLDTQPFTDKLQAMVDVIGEMGGFANLTQKQLRNLEKEVLNLRAAISGKLELAEFFERGGDAVEELKKQLIVVDRILLGVTERLDDATKKPPIEIKTRAEGGQRPTTPIEFRNLLRDLRREGELLQVSNRERAIRETLFAAEAALTKPLSDAQKALVRVLASNNLELARHKDILDEIHGPQEMFAQGIKDINKLLKDSKITAGEASDAIRDLRLAFLETQKDMASGFERAFLKMGKDAEDFASKSERLLTDAFKGAEDALVEFVTTGKLSFRDLANSIIADLARMAIQARITRPLFDFLGGLFSPGPGPLPDPAGFAEFIPGRHGGLLQGAGSGTSDSIPTLLSHGEFVTNAENTAKFLPLLQAINSFSGNGGGGNRAGGVVVQLIDQRGSQAAPVERRERTNSDGTRIISLMIRDTVKRQVSSGELDVPFQARFGLNPTTR